MGVVLLSFIAKLTLARAAAMAAIAASLVIVSLYTSAWFAGEVYAFGENLPGPRALGAAALLALGYVHPLHLTHSRTRTRIHRTKHSRTHNHSDTDTHQHTHARIHTCTHTQTHTHTHTHTCSAP